MKVCHEFQQDVNNNNTTKLCSSQACFRVNDQAKNGYTKLGEYIKDYIPDKSDILAKIILGLSCSICTAYILCMGLLYKSDISKLLLSVFLYFTVSTICKYVIYKRFENKRLGILIVTAISLPELILPFVFIYLSRMYYLISYSLNVNSWGVASDNPSEHYASGIMVATAIIVVLCCITLIGMVVRNFSRNDNIQSTNKVLIPVLAVVPIIVHTTLSIAFPHPILTVLTILLCILNVILLHTMAREYNVIMPITVYVFQTLLIVVYFPIGILVSQAYSLEYTASQCFNYGSLFVYLYILSICCVSCPAYYMKSSSRNAGERASV